MDIQKDVLPLIRRQERNLGKVASSLKKMIDMATLLESASKSQHELILKLEKERKAKNVSLGFLSGCIFMFVLLFILSFLT